MKRYNGSCNVILVVAVLACFQSIAIAQNFDCPEPTRQVANNVKGDLSGQAQTLIKLGAMDIKGQFESTVVDLFSKYQNADQIAIAQNLLSPACNFLKASNMSGAEKFDKWLQILPLMSRYFQDKRSDNVPEPKETKGLYITYKRSFFDSDTILGAFQKAGIRVEVKDSDCRTCRTTSLFCSPFTEREAIVKVALTLFDAGVKLTKITPGYLAMGLDPPAIELNSNGNSDDLPLSRSQIESISDCSQEYAADGKARRLITVSNDCPRILRLWYTSIDPGLDGWSSVRENMIFENETTFLVDDSDAYALTEYNQIYFYAETFALAGDDPDSPDQPIVWSGEKDDGTSVLQKLDDKRTEYFRLQTFPDSNGAGSYGMSFACPSPK
jgi:hypothetical protein